MPYEYSFKETRKFNAMIYDGRHVLDSYDVSISLSDLSKNDARDLRMIIEEFCG